MAMRPRRGSVLPPRPSMRPTYESFRPRFEWKYVDNATLLLLYLPGFVKEQIRIETDEISGLMQIQGQRLVAPGRWSVFNQSFMIPSACDWTQITSQFELGVLTIIMPTMPSFTIPSQNVDAQPKTTQQLPTTTTITTPQDEKVALQDETTATKASTDMGKQLDHHQEMVEPIVDDAKKLEAIKEKTEKISPDDHKLPKAEKDHMLKKGVAAGEVKAKNMEHESDVEEEKLKSDEQVLLVNMVIAALVLMGLGAHIFSIFGSSKTA